MTQEGLWLREHNRSQGFSVKDSATVDGLARKYSRDGAPAEALLGGRGTSGSSTGNGSYHLGLIHEVTLDDANNDHGDDESKRGFSSSPAAFDFVCSSSGVTTSAASEAQAGREEEEGETTAVGFDRVCALRGEVVHILTFFHERADDDTIEDPAAATVNAAARPTISVSLELEHPAECAAWNSAASCVVIGDASGRLHFVTGEGTLIFSQPLLAAAQAGGGGGSSLEEQAVDARSSPRAFSCIKFATRATSSPEVAVGDGEELLAVSASMQLYHFANVPIKAIEAACLAKDVAELKRLRASILVSIADASGELSCPSSSPQDQLLGTSTPAISGRRTTDACLQQKQQQPGGDSSSRVYLVSGGGLSVWRRGRGRRHHRRGGKAKAAARQEGDENGGGEGNGGDAPSKPAPGKLVKVDSVPAGELFGGGGAVAAQLSGDGRWIIVVDDRGGLSWWDAQSLHRLGRWSWSSGTFDVVATVVLASTTLVCGGRGDGVGSLRRGGSGAAGTGGGGDARPCLACISGDGEVRVLRLGADGAEELHRAPISKEGAVVGALTVPSPSRHQFLMVTSDVTSGTVSFHLGKEAVSRHRLQALLARGEFDRALELARANSMDETDVHAARLLALLRGAGAAAAATTSAGKSNEKGGAFVAGSTDHGERALGPQFFEDTRMLFEKLDNLGVLGRACEAAVRAPLPTLEDVRKLLEVVENRLRSFDKAGARIRNLMLERIVAVLARLYTFELVEGGRRSTLSAPALPVGAAEAGTAGGRPPLAAAVGPSDGGGEGAGGRGGSSSAATRGKENEDFGGSGDDDSSEDGSGVPSLDNNGSDIGASGGDGGDGAGAGGGAGQDAATSEVARWLRFRTTDLVSFLGGALEAGDVQAASVVWRRHGRTDRGAGRGAAAEAARLARTGAAGAGATAAGGSTAEEGRRLELALPGQLADVPAVAPPVLLGGWLRDEVLPCLDAAGVMAVRDWAEHHAREVEALEKRPHGALLFARAVAGGSSRVLGSAAEMLMVHSAELAAAEETVAARTVANGSDGGSVGGGGGLGSNHWKRWKPDGLDSLGRTLDDLAHAWDAHRLRLPLSAYEKLPRDVVLFRVLDRVQSPDWLPEEISHHVLPLAKRYRLDPDEVLLDYMRICADAMVPRCRANTASGGGSVAPGTGANTGGVASGGLTTEQRAIAVARCMSAGEGCRSELRSKAVLALANAASFPFSEGLRDLVQEALSWGGSLDEELRRAATTLDLSQIVQRYHVTGFSLVDAPRATRLLRHVLAQVRCPTALDDGLKIAHAYSHLSERNVYVEFLENLAGSYPTVGSEAANSNHSDGEVPISISDESEPWRATGADAALNAGGNVDDGGGDGGNRLAADLTEHRARVSSVLRRLPAGDARRVAEEVMLYLVRLLEDLELDAGSAGLKPGQLWGCKAVSEQTDVGSSTATAAANPSNGASGSVGVEAVVLEPGSDAEQAVLVAAAAAAVVAFLREMQQQRGGAGHGSEKLGNLAAVANDLRRVSALQTEFGAFMSLKTLGRPRGRACWNVMKEGLVTLEEHLHGDDLVGDGITRSVGEAAVVGLTSSSSSSRSSRGAKKGGGRATGSARKTPVRAVPRLLHRARRLSELLGVAWPSVVSHLANEAATRGKVPEAVGLCHTLFRDQATMDERAAALALRDTAKALSTFVANQAHMGALRADDQKGARARTAVLQAMAQSVRGLRQSAVLCGAQELPLTMDLLQGSEAVAAVLCRCEGGDELEALLAAELSPSPRPRSQSSGDPDGSESKSFQPPARSEWDADALAGLYKWYPGDGRVLPLEEALKLVSVFVRQEMRLRAALVGGDAIAVAPAASAGIPPLSSSTEALLSSKWEAGLEKATSPLLSFLQGMGAQQLCLRVVSGMAVPPPCAVDVLGDAFSGLADKVLEFNHIDCPLAIGYMLAMPTKQAYDTFRRTIRYSSDDYGRLRTLAGIGMYAARAWSNHDLLQQCIEVERDSHWWHVLTSLGIAFDNRGFSRSDRSQVPGEYQKSLVPAVLERSGCDLALALEFCERYGVGEAFPCLLYVENQLGSPCVSPHDVSYQERITEVLPSVHGVFLSRMLRHMLGTPGIICGRDYERLSFVYGILLSEKCQEEEEDSEEEIKRLEDNLEALAILKDYRSPWPLDEDGLPIVVTTAGDPQGGRGEQLASAAGGAAREVYARRLPFMALMKEPWAVLEAQLRPDSVSNLVPLADPLGLGVGEFYARLVTGMLTKGRAARGDVVAATGGTPSVGNGAVPTFPALQPWLEKIKDPALACMTAQRVAVGMTRDEDRLEALRMAIGHAIDACSPSIEEGLSHPDTVITVNSKPSLTLLPLSPPAGQRKGREDSSKQDANNSTVMDVTGVVDIEEAEAWSAEDVVDGLEQRALQLEHLMTAKAQLGAEMAERLSPFLLAGSTELLTKILVFAAERAADAALAVPSFPGEVPSTNSDTPAAAAATTTAAAAAGNNGARFSSTGWITPPRAGDAGGPADFTGTAARAGGGENMSDFRRRATGALRTARSMADQRGMDPHDVETIIFRLAKGWICQQKLGGGGGGGGGAGERDAGMFVGAGLRGGGGGESVFVKDAREERLLEDATLGLRAAFVLTVTFSDDAEDGDTSVCDSIAFMDLKSRISVLLSMARDGRKDVRSSRMKFRARLRALLALSALAPPTLVAEVMASDRDGWDAQAEGLSSLSDLRRNVGYMSELEEARLPHKLKELASCPAEDIVRALRRDHRGERGLIPLMCDMLLDARSGDVGLWSPILADACRHDDLRRVLIMRVFPRVVRSNVADAFARSGAVLAASWEEVLRSPLQELKARQERRRKKEAAAATAAAAAAPGRGASATVAGGAFPGASSTSFGASLYAMTAVGSGRARGGAAAAGKVMDAGGGGGERPREDVVAVVEQVVLLLRACPFPERLDLRWFSATLASLGPRFHAYAVTVALSVPSPATRTAAVLQAVWEGGVPLVVVLDELLPVAAGDGSIGFDAGAVTANQAVLNAIFLDIDQRHEWAKLRGTRHFDVMACTLVRAGRARGMVVAALAAGNREEAYSLCQMHYAVGAPAPTDVEDGDGAVAAVAAGERSKVEGDDGGGDATSSKNFLARFAEEYELQSYVSFDSS